MTHKPTYKSLRLLLIVTLGVAAVWIVAGAIALIQWEMANQGNGNESLVIDVEGQARIDSYQVVGGFAKRRPMRTLDGEEVSGLQAAAAPRASLPVARPYRPFTDGPIVWTERLLFADHGDFWYLVRDAAADGHAYLVAYDRETKFPTRYAARSGFSTGPPLPEDHFNVGPPFNHQSRRVVGIAFRNDVSYDNYADIDPRGATPRSCLYVLDDGELLGVDVTRRIIDKLGAFPAAQALAITERPQVSGPQIGDESEVEVRMEDLAAAKALRESALLIRMPASFIVLDPRSEQRQEVPLPEEFQAGDLDVYSLRSGGFVLDRKSRRPSATVHHLAWLDREGKVERTKEAAIETHVDAGPRVQAILATLMLPTLLFLSLIVVWSAPRMLSEASSGLSYSDALQQSIVGAWPAVLVLVVISLGFAALVYRWQRENNRPRPVAWAVAAFLLGVPGFIAYLILHGRPSVARARTHKIATAEPKLLGIEIFA
ncbi:hypothetical protein [Lacipirellula sp.]|uniref:hypothetical protein n=1 Tax=Lacipirellula sp. TaxID=2691419 RepID=UPI003D0C07C4